MKIVVRPMADPTREIDVTGAMVEAIARELARHCGGNEQVNLMEAERHLSSIVGATPGTPLERWGASRRWDGSPASRRPPFDTPGRRGE